MLDSDVRLNGALRHPVTGSECDPGPEGVTATILSMNSNSDLCRRYRMSDLSDSVLIADWLTCSICGSLIGCIDSSALLRAMHDSYFGSFQIAANFAI